MIMTTRPFQVIDKQGLEDCYEGLEAKDLFNKFILNGS